MNLEEFLRKFINATRLTISLEDLVDEIITRTIYEIKNDDDPENDYYAEALEMAIEKEELLIDFINKNKFYLNLFLACTLILFEEKTRDHEWNKEQQQKINQLLDEVEPYLELPQK